MTIIVPVNVDSITQAIKEIFEASPDLQGVQVERYEEVSVTPGVSGWLGIYREGVEYPPRTLGMGSGHRQQLVRLIVVACESDSSSGEECGQRLDDLLQKAVGALLSDPSLKGTVQTLDQFSVRYDYDARPKDGVYLQAAQLNFTGVIPVSAM